MNIIEIAKNYSKDKRKTMTDSVITNRNYMRNFSKYHAQALQIMYAEWHLLFPKQRQDLKCSSCRSAVNKFWETMVDEWIEEEREKPPQKTKKNIGSKKRKAK